MNSKKKYNWKRFWCPRDKSYHLDAMGFLRDPDADLGFWEHGEAVSYEDLATTPCLVLLGEPGIGKSTVLNDAFEFERHRVAKSETVFKKIDLRSYSSDIGLREAIFKSPEFVNWNSGMHQLRLFLDSFDEALLRVDTIAAILADELPKYPAERLYLRIACRSAEWPKLLDDALCDMWPTTDGIESFQAVELLPLRRQDVAQAGTANNLDSDEFIRELDSSDVVPLAIRPVTLNFLIGAYKESQRLPGGKAELYETGCLLLCREISESRIASRRCGILTPIQRLTVAGRIAAATIFSNKSSVTSDTEHFGSNEIATIQELAGGEELVHGYRLSVSESTICEALETGLFSLRGQVGQGWIHRTHAEFLAARYVFSAKMSLPQILSLFIHPADPQGKFIPQLHGTLAWLCAMSQEVMSDVLTREPVVLLRSDLASAPEVVRAQLVDALLGLLDREEILDDEEWEWRAYSKLKHHELEQQLRPYIHGTQHSLFARRAALDIAGACDLQCFFPEILRVALDCDDDYSVRVNAARIISHSDSTEAKRALRPLLSSGDASDPDDELKGVTLRALCPDLLNPEELFALLTFPKNEKLIGIYSYFLKHELPKHIQAEHLQSGLCWVAQLDAGEQRSSEFEALVNQVMLLGWQCVEEPGLTEAFAKAVLARIRNHCSILPEDTTTSEGDFFPRETPKRRELIKALIPLMEEPEDDIGSLLCSGFRVEARGIDLAWALEQLNSATSEQEQLAWSILIDYSFSFGDPHNTNLIIDACNQHPVLEQRLERWMFPIALDSAQASKLRAYHERHKERELRCQKKELLTPPPSERVATILGEIESGKHELWPRLCQELSLEPDSTHYGSCLDDDLVALPGWLAADEGTRERIISCAEQYLAFHTPSPNDWLGKNRYVFADLDGYKAFRLLQDVRIDALDALSPERWKSWAVVIVAFPTGSGLEDDDLHYRLVQKAYACAPAEVVDTVLFLVKKADDAGERPFIFRKLEYCWDELLSAKLFEKAQELNLRPKTFGWLLRDLLRHHYRPAVEFARNTLLQASSNDQTETILEAATALMLIERAQAWDVLWPVLLNDEGFGKHFFLYVWHEVSERDEQAALMRELSEQQLTGLYLYLYRLFPPSPEDRLDGFVSARQHVGMGRDDIIRVLKHRGNQEACTALENIQKAIPALNWLKFTLIEARRIARTLTWCPPTPKQVIELARSSDRRYIQSGEQLMSILLESLQRLEKELHAETPAVIDLWNVPAGPLKTYSPKPENDFSDSVKRFLDRDLKDRPIVVNREVRIHRGESTDIHVDAVTHDEAYNPNGKVTVIIEVKGCWHRELKTAMRDQLVTRYLRNNRCTHGIYLIGWFKCARWDAKDDRSRANNDLDLPSARQFFDSQAQEHSRDGVVVKSVVLDTSYR